MDEEKQIIKILTQTISADSNISINLTLIKTIGLIPAVMFQFYMQEYKEKGQWFKFPHTKFEQILNLKKHTVREGKKVLIDLGILTSKREGIPAKELFNINFGGVLHHLTVDQDLRQLCENAQLVVQRNSIIYTHNPKQILFNIGSNNTDGHRARTRTRKGIRGITPQQFDLFWTEYPNKTDKGRAKATWQKLCNKPDKPTLQQIIRAINKQKESERWKNGVIMYPSTWLNNFGWLNDPEQMKIPKDLNKKTGYKGQEIEYKTPIKV